MSGRDVMMSKAQETNIQIRVDVPNEMPLMEADRDKIKQILLNLLSNSIKYNRPNGSVIITSAFDTTNISITIQDTGMASRRNPFLISSKSSIACVNTRAKPRAQVLGLSICKQIVQDTTAALK